MSFASVLRQIASPENPFPGLRPFETEDTHLFFGRDQQTAELARLLQRKRFVGVVGVSGGGKSSLVRAGLIPALHRGQVREIRPKWRVVIARPGAQPFENLEKALHEAGLNPGSLRRSSMALAQLTSQLDKDTNLFVLIDQFEELFRYQEILSRDKSDKDIAAAEAADFVQLLLAASRQHHPPVFVVLTMRSDYLGACAQFRDLPETLNQSQYLVPRLTRQEREQAITGPLIGVEMTPELVQRLLNDVGDEPEQLPVLQHALMRTWDHWHKSEDSASRRIEVDDYQEIGGFEKALNDHADEVLRQLDGKLVETIFRRLTARGPSNRERRDPAKLEELWDLCGARTEAAQKQVTGIVDTLRTPGTTFLEPRKGDLNKDTDVDITHESLIRLWVKLRDEWLVEEQKAAKTLLDLADRAERRLKHDGEVLRGLDLADARQWRDTRNQTETWAHHYVTKSALDGVLGFIRESDRAELWRQTRARAVFYIVSVAAVLFLVIAGLAVWQWRKANGLRESADVATARAVAASNTASLGEQKAHDSLAALQSAQGALKEMATEANDERKKAVDARNAVLTAQSQGLVGKLTALAYARKSENELQDALLFATEAFRREETPENRRALQELLAFVPRPIRKIELDGPVHKVAVSAAVNAFVIATEESVRAVEWSLGGQIWKHDLRLPIDIVVSPDGTKLAACSPSGTVLLEVKTGRVVWEQRSFPALVLAFSPDGRVFAVSYVEFAILAADDGRVLRRISKEQIMPHAVAFSADGQRFAIAGQNGADLFDGRTGDLVTELRDDRSGAQIRDDKKPASSDSQNVVRFRGRDVVTGAEDGMLRYFDASGSVRWRVKQGDTIREIVFSPDAKWMATASDDGTARVYEADTGTQVSRVDHPDVVQSVAFNHDSELVASGSDDGTARIFDRQTGREISRVNHGGSSGVGVVAFSGDGKYFVSGGDGGEVQIVEIARDEVAHMTFQVEDTNFLGKSEDAGFIAMSSKDVVKVFSTTTGKVVGEFKFAGAEKEGAISLDGRLVAIRTDRTTVVSVVDGRRVSSVSEESDKTAFSPDGRLLVVGTDKWRVFDSSNGALKATLNVPFEPGIVAFSRKATRFAVAEYDGDRIAVFDTTTFQQLSVYSTDGKVDAIAVDPAGRLLAVNAGDGHQTRILNAISGSEVMAISGRTEEAMLAFSPDGTQLAIGGKTLAKVNAVATGAELWRWLVPGQQLVGIAHDGNRVRVVGGAEGGDHAELITAAFATARDVLLAKACARLQRDFTKEEWAQYAGPGIPYEPTCAAVRRQR